MKKRSARLGMRVRQEDKERWQRAAKISGLSLSAFIETCLNERVKLVDKGNDSKPSTVI